MIPVLSRKNMKKSDQAACELFSAQELMRRAGDALFSAYKWVPPVGILCGSGNNAGDGYALALKLKAADIDCVLIRLSDRVSDTSSHFLTECKNEGIPEHFYAPSLQLDAFGTLVDCIFGIGFHGEVKGTEKQAILAANASGVPIVSADINSGLDADSGLGDVAIESELTVSIGSFKAGHFLGRAKDVIKNKVNFDIGISPADKPYLLLQAEDAKAAFPKRLNHAHKGSYGYVALMGGSLKYSGAIRLANMANCAMRGGAGVAILALPKSIAAAVMPQILESTLFPLSDENGEYRFSDEELRQLFSRADSLVMGMGLGLSEDVKQAVQFAIQNFDGTLCLDADALNALAALGTDILGGAKPKIILTPHLKEFSRLSGLSVAEIESDPIAHAAAFAKAHGVVLLLKGPTTVITDGEEVLLADRGCGGMATAGSGDVLCGIIAATCGQNPDNPLLAAAAAAFVAGCAGEKAQSRFGAVSMVASDTAGCLAEAVKEICEK